MTNLFRRGECGELAVAGEARVWRRIRPDALKVTDKATFGHITWLRAGCSEGKAE
jgi:hypothetical protein